MERVVVLSLVLFDPAFAGRMDERALCDLWPRFSHPENSRDSQPCYEKKIRPMALCAGLCEVEVRALEALGMGGDYPRA